MSGKSWFAHPTLVGAQCAHAAAELTRARSAKPGRGAVMAESRKVSKGPVLGYFGDKSVIVTGASSGIGHDVALAFGEQGAKVALLARRRVQLEELAKKIDRAGGRALALD